MPELVGVTNLAPRLAFMATTDENGEVEFWDKDANIIEITAYPTYDDGAGGSDWGYEQFYVTRAGDGIAVGDINWPLISFVDSRTLNLRKTFLASGNPRDTSSIGPLGVGSEFWAFTDDFTGDVELYYVRRFSARGDLLGTLPLDGYGVGIAGSHSISWVATWDQETFYIVDGEDQPAIWQWTPGSPVVFLGSIWNDLQGPYPGDPFHGGGEGECRTIAMHGPNEMLATTYNRVFDSSTHTHSAMVRFSVPDLTVLNRYEISDNIAHIPLLDTTVIPLPTGVDFFSRDYVLPFICASDGQQMWVANWVRGEIWKVSDSGEFTLWNHLLDSQLSGSLVRGLERPNPVGMNVRDFVDYPVPMASFHNRVYPGPRHGVSAYAHQATDPTIKYAAPRRLQ